MTSCMRGDRAFFRRFVKGPLLTLGCVLTAWSLTSTSEAATKTHTLVVERATVNLSGKKAVDFALHINGSIPAPTLEFTEGDDVEIKVVNKLEKEEVSIHWHGILLPPLMDGVPYVNTPPIFPGQSFTFKFRLRQHGTYWYHSHTNVQEQKGLYGAFVVHPKKAVYKVDHDVVAVLSDWSDEDALDILANLRKEGHYYMYKKGSIRSLWGAVQAGKLKTFVHDEWTRMGGMDVSDVGYDAFLINGKKETSLAQNALAGETVRIRIINAAASSYFHLALGDTKMKVISADGLDIEPVETDEILIGMAETVDILFKVPDTRRWELRATSQDITGYASAWIGGGSDHQKSPATSVRAPTKPALDPWASHGDHGSHAGGHGAHDDHGSSTAGHDNHKDHSAHVGHQKNPAPVDPHAHHKGHAAQASLRHVPVLTVDDMKASNSTALKSKSGKRVEIQFTLDGDMSRYIWHLNGKAIHQDREVLIDEGDVVVFKFVNQSMMHHPMHLHGQDRKSVV